MKISLGIYHGDVDGKKCIMFLRQSEKTKKCYLSLEQADSKKAKGQLALSKRKRMEGVEIEVTLTFIERSTLLVSSGD